MLKILALDFYVERVNTLKIVKLFRFFVFILIFLIIGLLFFQYINIQYDEDAPMPTGLHPVVEEKSDQLISRAAERGINVVITDDFRSADDQDALYDKGRSVDGNIVTHAKGGESYHNYGLAIDFALLTVEGDLVWDMEYDGNGSGTPDWMEVVTIAKDLGFKWGGDWANFKDYPHLQYDFGLSIKDLQRGKRPPERE
ncbi:M15 family metallopeptidase [Cytobacillus horneckiae]|nr:M15 family metallopeptidase [Cytobacillus horneckiae]MBN6886581.1 M15 family metallopeptidase [Cytobacillus horneckiae]MCM3177950.1 M15 family metallopeptidase [Cytobacillus horneckiae]